MTGGAGRPWTLHCAACGGAEPGGGGFRCPACGGVRRAEPPPGSAVPADSGAPGMWRYRSALPPVPAPVTMDEGGTPLLDRPALAERFGVAALAVKDETRNPTLSFKDRAMSLGVSLAAGVPGLPGVVAASTGNTAVSAAAYAALAGVPCRLVCAEAAAGGAKLRIARALGAEVRAVPGDFSAAHRAAAALEEAGWYTLTTTFRNPFLAEAHRSVAFEIAAQTLGRPPGWVLVPVGAGPLLWGIHQGFAALHAGGLLDAVPRMVAVQAAACAPIVRAFDEGAAEPAPADPGPTSAGAIADPLRGYTDEGALTLRAVRASGGAAVAVDDTAIEDAMRVAARACGLLLEPAAAAPLAAVAALRRSGAMPPGAEVAVLATGHGAKEPDRLAG
ncbi:threonine synthase [Murinocardiopsis flavida]|uniref:Threonine synthase n=1 Tax=Murinocardiopsis flavida TaxID=645275 RepID=A0A2P8CXI9_9ACTN|nr:pyridoxal-phosphate dependent enzyme [Murinocardiopsis flavida]PSK89694.1 threonine synthase [Murinocardiopsis flavida]